MKEFKHLTLVYDSVRSCFRGD